MKYLVAKIFHLKGQLPQAVEGYRAVKNDFEDAADALEYLTRKELEVPDGTRLFDACTEARGEALPHFCYHPDLSIAGVCRLCQVEVEGMPKLTIACNTIVRDGMVVHTRSQEVLEARSAQREATASLASARETLHLVRDHRETTAGLARHRCLDRRVEREDVGLFGDIVDQFDDVADLLRTFAQTLDAF